MKLNLNNLSKANEDDVVDEAFLPEAFTALMNSNSSIDEELSSKGIILLEEDNVRLCKKMLLNLASNPTFKEDILLFINCAGGELFEFLSLHDTMLFIRKVLGRNIITVVNGIAASGAVLALEAGSHRLCTKNSFIMLHEISGRAEGSATDIEDDIRITKQFQQTIFNIWAKPMGLSAKELHEYISNKDRYFTAKQAVQAGLIDKIIASPAIVVKGKE